MDLRKKLVTRRYSLIEMLAWVAIGVMLLNGIVLFSGRMTNYHRQQIRAAWNLQEERVLAERWRQFAADTAPGAAAVIKPGSCQVGEQVASFSDGILTIGGKETPLPKGVEVAFKQDQEQPSLLILQLRDPGSDQTVRMIGRGGKKVSK